MNTPSPDWPDEATRTPGARLVVRRDADTLTIAYVVEAADGSINAQLATGEVSPPTRSGISWPGDSGRKMTPRSPAWARRSPMPMSAVYWASQLDHLRTVEAAEREQLAMFGQRIATVP
jgi:hypothetical protein